MHSIVKTAFALILFLIVAGSATAQPFTEFTEFHVQQTISNIDNFVDFEEPVLSCLETCLVAITERTDFNCSPVVALPTSGCDLPWPETLEGIGGFGPTPLPWADVFSCIPEDPTLLGYRLFEDRQLVEQRIHHRSDCTTTVTETVLQDLPPTGAQPRSCPDVAGWRSTEETTTSVHWVACQEE